MKTNMYGEKPIDWPRDLAELDPREPYPPEDDDADFFEDYEDDANPAPHVYGDEDTDEESND